MPATLDPVQAIAESHALLLGVASGFVAPGVRIYRPRPTVAFGRMDARAPRFREATRAAHEYGLDPVMRLVGGRVAVYTSAAVVVEAFTAVTPETDTGVDARFAALASTLVSVLRERHLDARLGALPGEYCPGTYSINLGGAVKVAGVGQRVIRGGAVTSAVITVGDGVLIRRALTTIQDVLGVAWEPDTAGAIAEHAPGLTADAVEHAVRAAMADHAPVTVDDVTSELAFRLRDRHALLAPAPVLPASGELI